MLHEFVDMDDDLREKLRRLCVLHDQPESTVAEHFFWLRNSIDYDAELLIRVLDGVASDEQVTQVSKTRTEFVRLVRKLEAIALERLASESAESSSLVYAGLREKVNEFAASECQSEDAYVELALEIGAESDRLRRRLFGGQTIVYVSSIERGRLGHLVNFGDEFLSMEELESLKSACMFSSPEEVKEAVIRAINSSLVVPASRPFALNRNMALIYRLVDFISSQKELDSALLCFGKPEKELFESSNLRVKFLTDNGEVLTEAAAEDSSPDTTESEESESVSESSQMVSSSVDVLNDTLEDLQKVNDPFNDSLSEEEDEDVKNVGLDRIFDLANLTSKSPVFDPIISREVATGNRFSLLADLGLENKLDSNPGRRTFNSSRKHTIRPLQDETFARLTLQLNQLNLRD